MSCCGSAASAEGGEEGMLDAETRVGEGAKQGRKLQDDYKLVGPVLGFGRMATVREAVEKQSGARVAVKSCSKKILMLRPPRISRTLEIEALLRVSPPKGSQCPHIIKLRATYEDKQQLHVVTELAEGGDLFHHIAGRDSLREADVRSIAQQLLEGVSFCHCHGVVHRDLKPENILLQGRGDPISVKLVDFGSAAIVPALTKGDASQPSARGNGNAVCEAEVLRDFMGTPFYAAPEVWTQSYGKEADLWSVGAILFVLFTGLPPSGLTRTTVWKDSTWLALQKGDTPHLPSSVSKSASDLLRSLLHPDPACRISAEDALRQPWIAGDAPLPSTLLERSIHGIRSYAAIQKFRYAAVALLAVLLQESELEALTLRLVTQSQSGTGSGRDPVGKKSKESLKSLAAWAGGSLGKRSMTASADTDFRSLAEVRNITASPRSPKSPKSPKAWAGGSLGRKHRMLQSASSFDAGITLMQLRDALIAERFSSQAKELDRIAVSILGDASLADGFILFEGDKFAGLLQQWKGIRRTMKNTRKGGSTIRGGKGGPRASPLPSVRFMGRSPTSGSRWLSALSLRDASPLTKARDPLQGTKHDHSAKSATSEAGLSAHGSESSHRFRSTMGIPEGSALHGEYNAGPWVSPAPSSSKGLSMRVSSCMELSAVGGAADRSATATPQTPHHKGSGIGIPKERQIVSVHGGQLYATFLPLCNDS